MNLFFPFIDFSLINFYPYNFNLSDLKILKRFFVKKLAQKNLTDKERYTLNRILKVLRKDQAWLLYKINSKYKKYVLTVGKMKKQNQLTGLLYLYRNGTDTDQYLFKEDRVKQIPAKDFYFYYSAKASFLFELKRNKFLKFWNLYKKNKFYNRYTRKFIYKIPAHLKLYDFFYFLNNRSYITKLKQNYDYINLVINRKLFDNNKNQSLYLYIYIYMKRFFDYFYFQIFLLYKKYYELFFCDNDYETYFPSLVLNINSIIARYSFHNIFYNFRVFFTWFVFNFLVILFFKFIYSKYDMDLDDNLTDIGVIMCMIFFIWFIILFNSQNYFLMSGNKFKEKPINFYY